MSRILHHGLFFNKDSTFHVEAFCDNDWVVCPLTRRSVSGYFTLFGGTPVSWESKKQVIVSLSLVEAKHKLMH